MSKSEAYKAFMQKERYIRGRMEAKGFNREQAEVDWQQQKIQEKTGLIISGISDQAYEAAMKSRKDVDVNAFLGRKQSELGRKKFETEREKLFTLGSELWDEAHKEKMRYYELEEQSNRQIMEWKELETPLHRWLSAEAQLQDWRKEVIENTVQARHRDFERHQHIVATRLKMAQHDPDKDFRERVLNPATREQALKDYLINHVNKDHFFVEAVKLLFEFNEKRR